MSRRDGRGPSLSRVGVADMSDGVDSCTLFNPLPSPATRERKASDGFIEMTPAGARVHSDAGPGSPQRQRRLRSARSNDAGGTAGSPRSQSRVRTALGARSDDGTGSTAGWDKGDVFSPFSRAS